MNARARRSEKSFVFSESHLGVAGHGKQERKSCANRWRRAPAGSAPAGGSKGLSFRPPGKKRRFGGP
ncbi:MAG: hypothetical protein Q8M88_14125, partial [Phenylobacterium sp.]|uniref:hypothetical protein n=1 Tax=Phenylobacterium sp. TaxID=1871053 RepID=UPI0027330484